MSKIEEIIKLSTIKDKQQLSNLFFIIAEDMGNTADYFYSEMDNLARLDSEALRTKEDAIKYFDYQHNEVGRVLDAIMSIFSDGICNVFSDAYPNLNLYVTVACWLDTIEDYQKQISKRKNYSEEWLRGMKFKHIPNYSHEFFYKLIKGLTDECKRISNELVK